MSVPEPRAASWSPGAVWPSLQIALGLGVIVLGLVDRQPLGLLLCGLLALFLIPAGALRLLRRPRLEVVDGQLAVTTLGGVRFVPPTEMVEVRHLPMSRWGIRQHLMRLEYTDEQGREQLDVFTRGDLGADPRDVVERLVELGFPGGPAGRPTG